MNTKILYYLSPKTYDKQRYSPPFGKNIDPVNARQHRQVLRQPDVDRGPRQTINEAAMS